MITGAIRTGPKDVTVYQDTASALPASLRAVLDTPPPAGDPLDVIEHVVILVQENRSLDHYFGTMRGVRGFADRSVVRQQAAEADAADAEAAGSKARTLFEQPDGEGGVVLPRPVDEKAIVGTPHDFVSGHEAWNGGRSDEWIAAKGPWTMSYYEREAIPFYYALADAFTVCDAYHCSVLGPTVPNRNYLTSGTTGFEPWGARAIENDAYDRPDHPGYGWTSYAERLQDADVSWVVLQEWDNYGCNNLEFHECFVEIGRKVLAGTGFESLRFFYEDLYVSDAVRQKELLAQLADGVANLDSAERSLYDRALRREPVGGLMDAFRAAVEGGTLPRVTWLIPSTAECEHPDSGTDAATGVALAERLVEALAASPEVYAKTVFLITYDENDGFFDHVPPPVPPPGTPGEEYVGDWPIGLGMRVPMTVVSPWSRGGYVCSETFDHTSVMRFLERWTGVEEPNISAWRRSMCGDLTATLGMSSAPSSKPAGDVLGEALRDAFRDVSRPASPDGLPPQEPGVRPARALPYQPDVFLTLAGELVISNGGSAPYQLAVYADRFRTDGPWRFDVPAGGTVTDAFYAEGEYDVSCYGPNRFLRRFTGEAGSGSTVTSWIRDGVLGLVLVNNGDLPAVFTVESAVYQAETRTYEVASGASVEDVWHVVRDAAGWYDLTVTTDVDAAWSRHLTGHVETGRDSVSG